MYIRVREKAIFLYKQQFFNNFEIIKMLEIEDYTPAYSDGLIAVCHWYTNISQAVFSNGILQAHTNPALR